MPGLREVGFKPEGLRAPPGEIGRALTESEQRTANGRVCLPSRGFHSEGTVLLYLIDQPLFHIRSDRQMRVVLL
jgi:hypothetical protein